MSGAMEGPFGDWLHSWLGLSGDKGQVRPRIPTKFDAQVEAAATNVAKDVANLNVSKASLLMPTSQNMNYSGSLIA